MPRFASWPRALAALPAVLVVGLVSACGAGRDEDSSIRRGDEAFALRKYDQALAEYRLALRQGADDAHTLARVAHTYAMLERVDDASTFYAQAVAEDSSLVDQAVSDLMRMAEHARERQDRFAMATAVERALRMRPGLGVSNMSLDLARHYFQIGEHGRALPFYENALFELPDSATADVLLEVGQAYEQIDDCQHALLYFERYREMSGPRGYGQVDWHIGTCGFRLAREIRAGPAVPEHELNRALGLVERTLELGEPRGIQPQAWFEKGLILSDLGDCTGAMEALRRVAEMDNAGALADRALAIYDEIRFGRGLEALRGGRCR